MANIFNTEQAMWGCFILGPLNLNAGWPISGWIFQGLAVGSFVARLLGRHSAQKKEQALEDLTQRILDEARKADE